MQCPGDRHPIDPEIAIRYRPGLFFRRPVKSAQKHGFFFELKPGLDARLNVFEFGSAVVAHFTEICSVGDEIKFRILEVDLDKDISLTCRPPAPAKEP